jgi:hypothetical protein
MNNKRHPRHPQAPSLDPDTHEPVETAAPAPPAADLSEVDVWKDRHLRLAAEYDNFRKRTTKERAESWARAQAELVARLADALDDLARFAHIDPAQIDAKTLHERAEAAKFANTVYEVTSKQYEAGGVSLLALLDAQRQRVATSVEETQAIRDRFADTAALFQALGGGWWTSQASEGAK